MMFKTSLTLFATAALGLAATAHADIQWTWAYASFFGGGYPVTGNGTLTTTALQSGSFYDITQITGTFAGNAITGLNASFNSADNILYATGALLDTDGLSFDDNTGDVANIVEDGGLYKAVDANANYVEFGPFTVTEVPAAAPEPSQVLSMLALAGLGGAGMLRRRK